MELLDLASKEEWTELEDELHNKTGLDISVFDTEGVRILDNRKWANDLCPIIKDTDKGQTFICAVAHSNVAAMARKDKKALLEECDGGLIKLVVPIFVEDEFLGVIGGCGLILEDSEVDTFYIARTADLDEDRVIELADKIKTFTTVEAESIIAYISNKLDEMIAKQS